MLDVSIRLEMLSLLDDRCRRENPVLRQLTAVRAAACWRLEEAVPELFTARSPGSGEPN